MFAIFQKELRSFFSSPIGYLIIGVFLVVTSLFLFVFTNDYNILDNGFASIKAFFDLAPWIFIFLIPAITMKSFAEEKKLGTMELLLTKPISISKLIFGKYLGNLVVVILSILPSILYVAAIWFLGKPFGNLDIGATLGSYLGLLFLSGSYTAIGLFCSSLTSNQIIAFISSVFLCFISYFACKGLADFDIMSSWNYGIEYFGIDYHYQSISRGVLDSRDVIYFISFAFLFLKLTHFKISNLRIH
ncbi:gliding motility-associated ABC transporter permease subunit GldF [Zunongwangia sp.]|uniref:gliding motility-associated ABC transporter permease subunit GldF n=1 Tax=Zunongwangia sp. TaxID=1965325 RepID=UPI003AA8B44F